LAVGKRKNKCLCSTADWLAGWLMKKEEKKKPAKFMIHKRFFLVCVCVLSSLKKMLCARIEKRRRMQMFPFFVSFTYLLCKPPNPPMRKNTTGKVEKKRQKRRYATDSKSAQTALPKREGFESSEKGVKRRPFAEPE
jgi:hypothetical protein